MCVCEPDCNSDCAMNMLKRQNGGNITLTFKKSKLECYVDKKRTVCSYKTYKKNKKNKPLNKTIKEKKDPIWEKSSFEPGVHTVSFTSLQDLQGGLSRYMTDVLMGWYGWSLITISILTPRPALVRLKPLYEGCAGPLRWSPHPGCPPTQVITGL